jgi:hypothetical protein
MRVDAGTSIALLAQAREDFHEQTALETVITFLRRYGRPRQMTFDRDPTLGGKRVGPGFPLTAASAPVVSRDYAPRLPAASTRQKCLRGAVSQNLWAGVLTNPPAEHAKSGCVK